MPLTPFVGQIMLAGFGLVPRGWALCDGSLLSIRQNQALFSLIGTTYGGDGVNTFALPDLRGRAVLGSNLGTVPWGQVDGSETASVSVGQLPSHSHSLQASTTAGTGRGALPTGNLFAKNTASPIAIFAPPGSGDVPLASGTNVLPDGGGVPHNNMQPYLVINYLIALNGVFPSRP